MSENKFTQNPKTLSPNSSSMHSNHYQRRCTCGKPITANGECDSCRKKRLGLQRKSVNSASTPEYAPPIVHEVLREPGRPLPSATRAFMESHFNHNFGHVRVHTNSAATQAAQAVKASAFTVGRHVVFNTGEYVPDEPKGKTLLAHELAHVVQQRVVTPSHMENLGLSGENDIVEKQANDASKAIWRQKAMPATLNLQSAPTLQRQEVQFDFEVPTPERAERLRQLGVDLPTVSTATVDPRQHNDYIDGKVNAVGFGIYLGGYALYIDGLDLPLFVPESHIDFGIQHVENTDNVIYPNRNAAEQAIPIGPPAPGQGFPVTYYRGSYSSAPRLVLPTIFSPATTPHTVLTMIRARRALARQVQEQMAILALTLIGAQAIRVIINRVVSPGRGRSQSRRQRRSRSAAGSVGAGFTATEREVVREAHKILTSPQFRQIRTAHASGESATIQIGNRTIQYEPGLPGSGMTMFGENGFLVGRQAFSSEAELAKTLLHELHRLNTSAIGRGAGASGAAVQAETQAAFEFAERAFQAFF